jgi:hypothetical protein
LIKSITIDLSGKRLAVTSAMQQIIKLRSQLANRFKTLLGESSLRHKLLNRKVVSIVAVILSTLAFGAVRLASDSAIEELDFSTLIAMRSPGERNNQALFQTKFHNEAQARKPFEPNQRVLTNYRFRRQTVILGDIDIQPFVWLPILPPIALLPENPYLSLFSNPPYSMPLGTPGERVSAIPVTPIPEPSIWLTMTIGMVMAMLASNRTKNILDSQVSQIYCI